MLGLRGRLLLAPLLLGVLANLPPCPVFANPTGGTVSAGNANISSSGNTLTVNQSTNSAVIDWRGFDVSPGETTNFVQPSSTSITLNRVNSPSASTINGALNANGNLVIVNQNGVLFGKNAKVNVNSLVVSTADTDNAQFMAGNYAFTKAGNPNATIRNEGSITAKQAGLVGFVAPNVLNSGIITAKLGNIDLASGDTFTVDLYGDNLMSVQASPALQSQLVSNSGKLVAKGGTIKLTAAAAAQTVNSLIQVGGELDAPAIAQKNGAIYIFAEGSNAVENNVTANKGTKTGTSAVLVTGKLNVSSKHGTGGTVNVLGDHVTLAGTASIKANGAIGGGTVNVGGQGHGVGTTPTALNTTIASGAVISANAAQDGSGGNVTVWSDATTHFNGSILAQGGAQGGNGGTVETSGEHVDVAGGIVNTTAPKGKMGNWLVDPAGLTIDAALASSIDASLSSTNVTLTTTSTTESSSAGYTLTGAEQTTTGNAGTITVNNPINAGSGTGSLTLSSYSDILINAGITLNGGSLTLQSNNAGAANGSSGAGAVYIGANIATNGGDINIGGGSGTISAGSGYALGDAAHPQGITLSANLSAGGGNITLNGHGFADSSCFTNCEGIFGIGSQVTTSGNGSINIHGIGGGIGSTQFDSGTQFYGSGIISAVNGDINITGVQIETGSGAASISFGDGFVLQTTGNGNINFTDAGVNGSGFFGYGSLNTVISGGNISYNGFTLPQSLWSWTAAGSITIAPYSNNTTMGIGSGSGSFNVSDSVLGNMTAASYVFGSSNVSTLTVNTATTFGSANLSFISGNTISFANSLATTGGNITFNQPVVLAADSTINAGSGTETFSGTINGAYSLSATAGAFSFGGALGGSTALGAVSLTSANAMTLPSITATSILAQTTGAAANLTIASGSVLTASGTGTPVTLAAGADFINSEGSGAISLTGAGSPRWLIFSTNPTGDTFGSLNSSNTAVWNATYAGTSGTVSESGNRYVFAYQPTVTVALTNNSPSKTYGTDDTGMIANDYSITGLQGARTGAYLADSNATAFSGTVTVTSSGSAASASVATGPYAITIAHNLTGVDGYAVAYGAAGSLTVGQANLTITANNQTITYGASVPNSSITYNGLVNNDSPANLTMPPTLTVWQSGIPNAGTYVDTYRVSGAASSNYIISYVNGALTVNKANLIVTTYGQSIPIGQPLPVFSGSNNLLAQDAPLVNWNYAPIGYSGGIGTYLIGAAASDPNNRLANYNITMNDGIFAVTGASADQIPSTVQVTSQNPLANVSPYVPDSALVTSNGSNNSNGANSSSVLVFTMMNGGSLIKTANDIYLEITPALQQQLGYAPQTN